VVILGECIVDKYFYCYSYPLKEFLIKNGIDPIFNSIHEKTQKKFWVFKGTEQLNKLLDRWRLNKK
jgi:hypothetical protein